MPTCAQAARLRIARITAVPTATFFMGAPIPLTRQTKVIKEAVASLVQKSHTSQAIYGIIGHPKHELAENAWFRLFPWGPLANHVAENAQAPTEVL